MRTLPDLYIGCQVARPSIRVESLQFFAALSARWDADGHEDDNQDTHDYRRDNDQLCCSDKNCKPSSPRELIPEASTDDSNLQRRTTETTTTSTTVSYIRRKDPESHAKHYKGIRHAREYRHILSLVCQHRRIQGSSSKLSEM